MLNSYYIILLLVNKLDQTKMVINFVKKVYISLPLKETNLLSIDFFILTKNFAK